MVWRGLAKDGLLFGMDKWLARMENALKGQ